MTDKNEGRSNEAKWKRDVATPTHKERERIKKQQQDKLQETQQRQQQQQ